jgi:hypothetical protein
MFTNSRARHIGEISMDTSSCLCEEKVTGPTEYERVVRQLRTAALDRAQSEALRERIRAATQC